jgi:hypothetical protein
VDAPSFASDELARGLRRRRRGKYALLSLLLLCVAAVYFGCFHTYGVTEANDGWVFRYSFRPFRCLHCNGTIDQLERQGVQVRFPEGIESSGPWSIVVTPVGKFEWYPERNWLAIIDPGRQRFTRTAGPITPTELDRGYYVVPFPSQDLKDSGKAQTPAHWCMVTLEDRVFWLDPRRIPELKQLAAEGSPDVNATSQASAEP